MANKKDNEKEELYSLLRSHGFDPVMRDTSGSTVPVSNDAEVFQFNFDAEGDSAPVTVSIDNDNKLVIYYGDDVKDTGTEESWYSLLKELKHYAQQHQLSFQLKNKDHLRYDMAKRTHMKKIDEAQINESLADDVVAMARGMKNKDGSPRFPNVRQGKPPIKPAGQVTNPRLPGKEATSPADWYAQASGGRRYTGDSKQPTGKMVEGYYPTGRKSSYSDNIPEVKIILQHSRALEEGERRYRAVEKIFVENTSGERFAIPTNKPGLARVYARHIAEGGTPYDEQGKHITALCEEYSKMAGFVRATRNKQFNESAQSLVNEGFTHYQKLRESLHKLSTHRGYHTFFENWTPTLMEDDTDATDLSEMFASNDLDPRIESVMPILRKLNKSITEVDHSAGLNEWADDIIEEALQIDEISAAALGHAAEREFAAGTHLPSRVVAPMKSGKFNVKHRQSGKVVGTYNSAPEAVLARSKMKNPDAYGIHRADQLAEVSNELLGRYKQKAGKEASGLDIFANAVAKKGEDSAYKRAADWATKRANKRFSGIVKATNKQFANDAKPKKLDELSNDKLGQYKKQASSQAAACDALGGPKNKLKAGKRARGIFHATKKQFYNDTTDQLQNIGESNAENVAINPEGIPESGPRAGAGGAPWQANTKKAMLASKKAQQTRSPIDHAKAAKAHADAASDPWHPNRDFHKEQAEKHSKLSGGVKESVEPILHKVSCSQCGKQFESSAKTGFSHCRDHKGKKVVDESLGSKQKSVGQLGPKDKVGPKGAVGKLVGANESVDPLSHIIKLSKG